MTAAAPATRRARFELGDIVLVGFHAIALALLAPSLTSVEHWPSMLAQSLAIIVLTLANVLWLAPRLFELGHVVRVVLTILSCVWGYERANALIRVFWGEPALERSFILADQRLFGGHASVWLQKLHHPWLTEWLQLSYVAYFALPLIVAIFLIFSQRWRQLPLLIFAVLLATHQNFIWYVLVPVRSPFLVVDTAEAAGTALRYDFELYGLWLTDSLRQGLLDATTMRHDCFPSGHTCLTTVTLAMAWRMHRGAFYTILPVGLSLIFSTLYLRYHYLVDVFAGLAAAALVVWASIRLMAWWEQRGHATAKPDDATSRHADAL